MKIKTVCELTRLTSRAIRHYIEEGLIKPSHTENYIGRKNYEFSEEDVKKLANIAVLRKFDFSIDEIRKIDSDSENSKAIIVEICARKSALIESEQSALNALETLDKNRAYSLDEIASELSAFSEAKDVPAEDSISFFSKLLNKLSQHPKLEKALTVILTVFDFIVLILGAGCLIYHGIIMMFTEWDHPYVTDAFSVSAIIVISLIPTIFALAVLIVAKAKNMPYPLGTGFCTFGISILPLFIVVFSLLVASPVESFTTDISDYYVDRVSDGDTFREHLFPLRPGENDAVYYYRSRASFDYTTDIYAEWSLEKKDFEKEVDRARKVFEMYSGYENFTENSYYTYEEIKYGDYTCLFRYNVFEEEDKPFRNVSSDYVFYIFAYDEQNLRVRYISCSSQENGAYQPYYLELDW